MKKYIYIVIWFIVLLFISCKLSIRVYPTISSKKTTINEEVEKDTICNQKNKKP